MGLWLCALFCPRECGALTLHLYKLFLFSLRQHFSLFKYIQYEVYFSLLNFVILEMLYGMYNKVIFFYKLQLKWFVLFFYGYLMMYNRRCSSITTTVCNQVCVIISVRFCGLCWPFVLTHCTVLLPHGTIIFFSWNIPKELFSYAHLIEFSWGLFLSSKQSEDPTTLEIRIYQWQRAHWPR